MNSSSISNKGGEKGKTVGVTMMLGLWHIGEPIAAANLAAKKQGWN